MPHAFSRHTMALAIAFAIPLTSTTIASLSVLSAASAQTVDAMPDKYFSTPAGDASNFAAEINTFKTISMLRHTYHEASREQKYNAWPPSQPHNEAHLRSERACYMAKARLALAILKGEGSSAARGVDIARVGVDLAESQKALSILKAASAAAWELSLSAQDDDPDRERKYSRHKLFSEGSGELEDTVKDIELGKEKVEFDAYSIIDWGVEQQWIDKAKQTVKLGADASSLQVYKAGESMTVDQSQLQQTARENQISLESKFGTARVETPAPASSEQEQSREQSLSSSPIFRWLVPILGVVGALGIAGSNPAIQEFVRELLARFPH